MFTYTSFDRKLVLLDVVFEPIWSVEEMLVSCQAQLGLRATTSVSQRALVVVGRFSGTGMIYEVPFDGTLNMYCDPRAFSAHTIAAASCVFPRTFSAAI